MQVPSLVLPWITGFRKLTVVDFGAPLLEDVVGHFCSRGTFGRGCCGALLLVDAEDVVGHFCSSMYSGALLLVDVQWEAMCCFV